MHRGRNLGSCLLPCDLDLTKVWLHWHRADRRIRNGVIWALMTCICKGIQVEAVPFHRFVAWGHLLSWPREQASFCHRANRDCVSDPAVRSKGEAFSASGGQICECVQEKKEGVKHRNINYEAAWNWDVLQIMPFPGTWNQRSQLYFLLSDQQLIFQLGIFTAAQSQAVNQQKLNTKWVWGSFLSAMPFLQMNGVPGQALWRSLWLNVDSHQFKESDVAGCLSFFFFF